VESGSLRLQARPTSPPVGGAWHLFLRLAALLCCVAVGVAIAALATLRVTHEHRLVGTDPASAADARIPAGACVLTDISSFTIVSNRFLSTHRACSQMVDSIGTDYALAGGRNALVGADQSPAAVRAWLSAFARAQYVWLNCAPIQSPACDGATARRIPWTPAIRAYFTSHFRAVPGQPQYLYLRDRP
jgi:hypothetical protein